MIASVALLFLINVIIVKGGVIGEQGAFPQNTIAVVGGNATLHCGYQQMGCFQIRWEKRSEFGRVENISDGDTVYDATKYRLNASSFCDLIIEDVQLTDSGTFVCRPTVNSLNSGCADLIVLQATPSCSSSCDSNSTAENDMVDFGCKLTYRGGARPEMIWWNKKNDSEVPDVPPQHLNGSTVSRDFSATAEAHGLVPPVCVTRFHFDLATGRASNVPMVQCWPTSCNAPSAAYYRSDGSDYYQDGNSDRPNTNVQTTQAPRNMVVIIGSSAGGGVGGVVVLLVILYCFCHYRY